MLYLETYAILLQLHAQNHNFWINIKMKITRMIFLIYILCILCIKFVTYLLAFMKTYLCGKITNLKQNGRVQACRPQTRTGHSQIYWKRQPKKNNGTLLSHIFNFQSRNISLIKIGDTSYFLRVEFTRHSLLYLTQLLTDFGQIWDSKSYDQA